MKTLKTSILTLIISLFLINCSSLPKLQKEAPIALKEVYYQKWNAGIKEESSGLDLYIRLADKSIILDSVYFQGQVAKLIESKLDSSVFIGHFKIQESTSGNLNNSLMTSFKINDKECIISYSSDSDKTFLYYKITNILRREVINYPSTRL